MCSEDLTNVFFMRQKLSGRRPLLVCASPFRLFLLIHLRQNQEMAFISMAYISMEHAGTEKGQ